MRFFMANAIKKLAKFFEIGHEMANLATPTLQCFPNWVPRQTGVPLKRLKCATNV